MFDFVGSAARSALKLLGGAEHEVAQHSPVESRIEEAIAALHHTAESMDRHVEVLEGVAAALPELTGALVTLTEQLGAVLHLAAPLEAAERDVAGIGHLFRRRRSAPVDTAAGEADPATPADHAAVAAPDGGSPASTPPEERAPSP